MARHIPAFTNEESGHYRTLHQQLEIESLAIGRPMTSKAFGSCDKFVNALRCKGTDHVAVFNLSRGRVDRGLGASRGNTKPYRWRHGC